MAISGLGCQRQRACCLAVPRIATTGLMSAALFMFCLLKQLLRIRTGRFATEGNLLVLLPELVSREDVRVPLFSVPLPPGPRPQTSHAHGCAEQEAPSGRAHQWVQCVHRGMCSIACAVTVRSQNA